MLNLAFECSGATLYVFLTTLQPNVRRPKIRISIPMSYLAVLDSRRDVGQVAAWLEPQCFLLLS